MCTLNSVIIIIVLFLHFNITSCPGHFKNMVKKSEDAKKKKKSEDANNVVGAREFLQVLVEFINSPGNIHLHTIT